MEVTTKNITLEQINDRFSRGKYLGIEVIIDMTNSFINGPHLVGQVKTSGGQSKEFKHWKKTKEYKELVSYISQCEDINVCDLVIDVTDAPNGFRGSYIHRLLVIHAAGWASPKFAYKISKILDYIDSTQMILPKIYVDPRIDPRVGCVYFISDGKYIKIGQTYDLQSRFSSLQSSNSGELTILSAINALYSEVIESSIHDELSDYHVRGEWFDINQEIIDTIVDKYQ